MSRIKIDKSQEASAIASDLRDQAAEAVVNFRRVRDANDVFLDDVHNDIVENHHLRRFAAYLQYGFNSLTIERAYLREARRCSVLALKYEQKAVRERSK
jgi:hypothetical protein